MHPFPPSRLMLILAACGFLGSATGALFGIWNDRSPADLAATVGAFGLLGSATGAFGSLTLRCMTMIFSATRLPGLVLAGLASLVTCAFLTGLGFALGIDFGGSVWVGLGVMLGVGCLVNIVMLRKTSNAPLWRPRRPWATLAAGTAGRSVDIPAQIDRLKTLDLRPGQARAARPVFAPLGTGDRDPRVETPKTQAPPPAAARLKRMPPGVTGDILCLMSEDHYVRVYTREGNGLVLRRFRDAIRDLERTSGPGAGMQVHRCWWVAKGAVGALERSGQALGLRLTNGLPVPVSRARKKEVEEATWLLAHPGPPGRPGDRS